MRSASFKLSSAAVFRAHNVHAGMFRFGARHLAIASRPTSDAVSERALDGWCHPINESLPVRERTQEYCKYAQVLKSRDFQCVTEPLHGRVPPASTFPSDTLGEPRKAGVSSFGISGQFTSPVRIFLLRCDTQSLRASALFLTNSRFSTTAH
jgi:hypothetical protein